MYIFDVEITTDQICRYFMSENFPSPKNLDFTGVYELGSIPSHTTKIKQNPSE